jgi:copper chaperone NosL
MQAMFSRLTRLLDIELDLSTRLLIVAAALLTAAVYVAPLWNLTMFAPQYPEGLRLDIWSYKLEGGNGGQDLKEINVLNHYIGMRDLAAEDFTEFHWIPFVAGALGLVMMRAAVHGRMKDLVDALVLMSYFSAFSLWSFAHKLWEYGHNLSPTAAVQVPGFMPPLFGFQQIANFEVYSYPQAASYALGGAMLLLMTATAVGWFRGRTQEAAGAAQALAHGVAGART